MRTVNKLILLGAVGYVNSGFDQSTKEVTYFRFSVATNQQTKNAQTGEVEETVFFHQCICFKQLAKICHNDIKLSKGDKVFVSGQIKDNSYKTKDGVQVKSYMLVVNELIKVDSKRDAVNAQNYSNRIDNAHQAYVHDSGIDDDIPF